MSFNGKVSDMIAAGIRAAQKEREERARSASATVFNEYRVDFVPIAEAQNAEAVVLLTELVSRLREPHRSELMIKAGDLSAALEILIDHLRSGAP